MNFCSAISGFNSKALQSLNEGENDREYDYSEVDFCTNEPLSDIYEFEENTIDFEG